MKTVKMFLVTCILGLTAVFVGMLSTSEVEASPSVTAAIMQGDALVPGLVSPHVILDLTDSVKTSNTNWKYLGTFKGTDFNARVVGASGYVDAGFASTAGLVFTVDYQAGISGGQLIETEDVLVKVTKLTFGAPDAGASTTTLDVGISGTTQRFMKSQDMLTTANLLGSQTIIYRQPIGSSGTTDGGIVVTSIRNVDTAPLTVRLTFTQSAKNLTTSNGGQADIYIKAGPIKTH